MQRISDPVQPFAKQKATFSSVARGCYSLVPDQIQVPALAGIFLASNLSLVTCHFFACKKESFCESELK